MKKTLLFTLLITCCVVSGAFAQTTFEEFKQQRERELEERRAKRDAAVFQNMQAYETYAADYERRYNAFKDEMTEKWGDFKERTQKNWVEYQKDGTVRWDVDFEEGTSKIEVLAEPSDTPETLQKSIEEAIIELVESKGTASEMPEEADAVLESPVLENQIVIPAGMDVKEFAREVAKETEIVKLGSNGEQKTIATINLQLAPDHLRIRAEKYIEDVQLNSQKYNLDPAMVLAIIHTESFFNPLAKSQANALGLMQVVPTTAGKDVYRVLYGKDSVPAPEYLFDPQQNVLFGSTYVDILMNRYMRGITNKTVHEYLVICAYNTGAGNVARAYTGSTNFNSARSKINGMSAEENYNFLLANLPWDETKNYLRKVSERRVQYREWMEAK